MFSFPRLSIDTAHKGTYNRTVPESRVAGHSHFCCWLTVEEKRLFTVVTTITCDSPQPGDFIQQLLSSVSVTATSSEPVSSFCGNQCWSGNNRSLLKIFLWHQLAAVAHPARIRHKRCKRVQMREEACAAWVTRKCLNSLCFSHTQIHTSPKNKLLLNYSWVNMTSKHTQNQFYLTVPSHTL